MHRDYGSMPPWPLYSLGKWVLMLLRLFMNWVQARLLRPCMPELAHQNVS